MGQTVSEGIQWGDPRGKVIESLSEREAVVFGVEECLIDQFAYTREEAGELVAEFRDKWMDPAFCNGLGTFWRSVAYVGHEGPASIATEVHYFQGMKRSIDYSDFLDWRQAYQIERRNQRRV